MLHNSSLIPQQTIEVQGVAASLLFRQYSSLHLAGIARDFEIIYIKCLLSRAQFIFVSSSNTAKLSSPLLLPRTVSYDASSKPPRSSGPYRAMTEHQTGRRRRSSSLIYQEPPETIEHMSDQAALPNLNANWVNAKGQSSSSKFPLSKLKPTGRRSVIRLCFLILSPSPLLGTS